MSAFGTQQKGTSKAGVNLEKEAGKRRDVAVSMRQKKKDELLREKRRRDVDEVKKESVGAEEIEIQSKRLPELAHQLHHGSPQEQLQATLIIRKLLSAEVNPPIDDVIQAQCIPKLVEFLKQEENTTLQFEASWALTNIASGTSVHTNVVIHSGAVPEFIRLLGSPSEDVREQSVWALGNIAGDSAKCRDLVLRMNALHPLLKIIHSEPKITTLRNATWCLSNLFRGKPIPAQETIAPALPTLAHLINHTDEEVIADACWAVSYASDGPNDRIEAVLGMGMVDKIISFLEMKQYSILSPALRTIGNIVTGTDQQTERIISAGILPRLGALMEHSRRNIRKECCWTISNITAGTKLQIEAVIKAGLLPPLIKALSASEFEVKKEALWAISNLTNGGSAEHIYQAVQAGAMQPMIDLLSGSDPKLIVVILEGIENILASGEEIIKTHGGENEYKKALMENGGIDKIEELQGHLNNDVHKKASNILEVFFEVEEVDDAEAFAFQPQAPAENAFSF